jgi:hypothetical protein
MSQAPLPFRGWPADRWAPVVATVVGPGGVVVTLRREAASGRLHVVEEHEDETGGDWSAHSTSDPVATSIADDLLIAAGVAPLSAGEIEAEYNGVAQSIRPSAKGAGWRSSSTFRCRDG